MANEQIKMEHCHPSIEESFYQITQRNYSHYE
jgi:hypothetical protein